MNIRIKIIQFLIHLNEKIFFYPLLKKYFLENDQFNNAINCTNEITIFDIGANKGQSIDFFKSIYSNYRIYAFEPNPTLFNRLKEKYKNNSNILLFNVGVSDVDGVLTFNESVFDETSTFEELNFDSAYLDTKASILGVNKHQMFFKKYDVPVYTLASVIADHQISKIDILKIDTEGHELKCLKGLFNGEFAPIKLIQLESHLDDMYLQNNQEEIEHLLHTNGFSLNKKIKHGFGNFFELIYKSV